MGKRKQQPRYNVVSCRLSNDEFDDMIQKSKYATTSAFLLEAIQEKIERMSNERKTAQE